MTKEDSFADQVLGGKNRILQELAADGVLPVAPGDLLSIQIRLAQLDDEFIAGKARTSLLKLGPESLVPFVQAEAEPEELSFIARNYQEPQVLEAVLQRRGVLLDDVVALAASVDPDLQEILLLRQDLIVEHPEILDALEGNPDLGRFARRRIDEYRLHLLASPPTPDAAKLVPHVDGMEDLTDQEQAEVAAEVQEVLDEVEPEGDVDPGTGLAEGQIRVLPAPIRAKLARGASRTLRSILIRDPNPQVATLVLSASAISESEVEAASANRYVCEEVLAAVCKRREWIRKYAILHNLVRNPRTPAGIAVKFVARLSVRDLGLLRMDRNVPDAVRQTAQRLHRIKIQ